MSAVGAVDDGFGIGEDGRGIGELDAAVGLLLESPYCDRVFEGRRGHFEFRRSGAVKSLRRQLAFQGNGTGWGAVWLLASHDDETAVPKSAFRVAVGGVGVYLEEIQPGSAEGSDRALWGGEVQVEVYRGNQIVCDAQQQMEDLLPG